MYLLHIGKWKLKNYFPIAVPSFGLLCNSQNDDVNNSRVLMGKISLTKRESTKR